MLARVDQTHVAAEFWEAMRLDGTPDPGWAEKGEPANADLLLWLAEAERHHVFALECSATTPPAVTSFSESPPHLRELLDYARRLEVRGVFTRIGAGLTGEGFAFSPRLIAHLSAFTTRDKPLYKLCQASSYASRFCTCRRVAAGRWCPQPCMRSL